MGAQDVNQQMSASIHVIKALGQAGSAVEERAVRRNAQIAGGTSSTMSPAEQSRDERPANIVC
jgi:hypothetical protein